MRNLSFIFASCFSILFISNNLYSQLEFNNLDSARLALVGEWEWIYSCGGLVPFCEYADSVDFSISFVVEEIENVPDSVSHFHYHNEHLMTNDTGKLYLTNTPFGSRWVIENDSINRLVIQYNNIDTITLQQECIDCHYYVYVRKAPDYTSLNNVNDSHWSIYPNPGTNYIRLNENDFDELMIFDVHGKRVLTHRLSDQEIYIGKLPAGMYWIRITKRGDIYTTPFIKY